MVPVPTIKNVVHFIPLLIPWWFFQLFQRDIFPFWMNFMPIIDNILDSSQEAEALSRYFFFLRIPVFIISCQYLISSPISTYELGSG